jgi:hypothetical protein
MAEMPLDVQAWPATNPLFPVLGCASLVKKFVKHHAGCHAQIERVAAAHHRNTNKMIAKRLKACWQPLAFLAHKYDGW